MANRITLLLLALGLSVATANAQTLTTDVKDYQTARKRLYLGTDTAAYFTAIRQTISATAAHKHLPTAKAVYDFLQTLYMQSQSAANPDGAKLLLSSSNTTGVELRGVAGLYAESVDPDLVHVGVKTGGLNLSALGQSGAATGQVITWSGTAWVPSAGSAYTYVTASSSISSAVNTVLIGTLPSDITLGLPTCDAATDGKQFLFQKSGTDLHGVTFDPSGTQAFADGSSTKTIFSTGEFQCTCRFTAGTGAWFFNF